MITRECYLIIISVFTGYWLHSFIIIIFLQVISYTLDFVLSIFNAIIYVISMTIKSDKEKTNKHS